MSSTIAGSPLAFEPRYPCFFECADRPEVISDGLNRGHFIRSNVDGPWLPDGRYRLQKGGIPMSRLFKKKMVAFLLGAGILFQAGSCGVGASSLGQTVGRALLFNALFSNGT